MLVRLSHRLKAGMKSRKTCLSSSLGRSLALNFSSTYPCNSRLPTLSRFETW